MDHTARLWVVAARDARVLIPPRVQRPERSAAGVPLHPCGLCQCAELAGPWLLRATVRVPLTRGVITSQLARRRWLGALHVRWLHYMGLADASLYEGPAVTHWASFGACLHGDVLVHGRKITSVSELRRPGHALLTGSTLLRPPPWELLTQALAAPDAEATRLGFTSVAAAECLGSEVDVQAWGATLRAMLHLSLSLHELQQDALDAE